MGTCEFCGYPYKDCICELSSHLDDWVDDPEDEDDYDDSDEEE